MIQAYILRGKMWTWSGHQASISAGSTGHFENKGTNHWHGRYINGGLVYKEPNPRSQLLSSSADGSTTELVLYYKYDRLYLRKNSNLQCPANECSGHYKTQRALAVFLKHYTQLYKIVLIVWHCKAPLQLFPNCNILIHDRQRFSFICSNVHKVQEQTANAKPPCARTFVASKNWYALTACLHSQLKQ